MVTKEELEAELGREPIEESEEFKRVPEDTRASDAEETPLSAAASSGERAVDQPGAQAQPIPRFDPQSPFYEPPLGEVEQGLETGDVEGTTTKEELEAELGVEPIERSEEIERVPEDTRASDAEETPLSAAASSGERAVDQPGAQAQPIPRFNPQSPFYEPPLGEVEQGLETGDVEGTTTVRLTSGDQEFIFKGPTSEALSRAEAEWVAENPEFTREDIRFVREEGDIVGELTESGKRRRVELERQGARQQAAEQLGAADEDVTVRRTDVTGYSASIPAPETEPRNIEEDLERQVGFLTLSGFGSDVPAAGQVGAASEGPELARGEDYFVRTTPEGRLSVTLDPELREQIIRVQAQGLFQEQTGVDLDPQRDIRVEGGQATLAERGQRKVAEQEFEAEYGVDFDPKTDIQIEDGTAALTESGVQRIETSDVGRLQSDIPVTSLRAVGFDRFGTALINRRPGEVPLPVGPPGTDVTIPLGQEGEGLAYDISQAYSERFVDPVATAVGGIDSVTLTSPTDAGEAVSRGEIPIPVLPMGSPQVRQDVPDKLSTFEEAGVRGALQFGNVGAAAGATIDAGEFVKAGAEETTAGSLGISYDPTRTRQTPTSQTVAAFPWRIEEAGFAQATADEAVERVEAGIQYAKANPIEFTGAATGAIVGSTVLMGGAASLSRGAGLTSRLAIQPGEELLGYGGARATRALGAERLSRRLFPNNEPLIFSEEAALRGARAAGARIRRSGQRTRRLARGASGKVEDAELPIMTRARTEFARPESSLGEFGGDAPGITGAPSEPLGSPTEGILDATTAIEGAGLDQPLPLNVRRGRVEGSVGEEGGPSAVPLFEDIRQAGGVRPYIRGEEVTGPTIFPSDVEVDVRTRMGSGLGAIPDIEIRRTRAEPEQRDAPSDFSNIQEELQRQNLAARRSLAGDFEGEVDPIGTERGRASEASRPHVDIEAESETGTRRRLETATELFSEEVSALGVDERVMQGLAIDRRVGQDIFTELGLDSELDSEQRQEIVTELGQELRTNLELDSEFEFEFEFETEFESEFDFETELEFETEAPGRGDRDDEQAFDRGFGDRGGGSVISNAFGAGWLNKWAVALAGGDLAARQAPEDIEAIAAERGAFLPLPTEGQVNPDEDLAAGLQAVDEFFFGGGGRGGGEAESDSDESGGIWGWFEG